MQVADKTELKKGINHILDLIAQINATLEAHQKAYIESTDTSERKALDYTIRQHKATKQALASDLQDLLKEYDLPNSFVLA
jgi:predicted  nucleic acid-binding Zn-ribbon protein